MNDSKQHEPYLLPVNTFEDRCVNQCNVYPKCPCGTYDAKYGIINKQKADGCLMSAAQFLLIVIFIIAIFFLISL